MASKNKKDWTDESAAAFVFWAQLCAAAHPTIHRREQATATSAADLIAGIPRKFLIKGYKKVDAGELNTEKAFTLFREMHEKLQLKLIASMVAISMADDEIQTEEMDLLGVLMKEVDNQEELATAAKIGLGFSKAGGL